MASRVIGLQRSTQTTGITGNTTFVLPAGEMLIGLYIRNHTSNTITDGVRIGTSPGIGDVMDQQLIGANSIIDPGVTGPKLLKTLFSMEHDQTLYFEARGAWNGASLDVDWYYARVGDDIWDRWEFGARWRTHRPDVHKVSWDVLDKLSAFTISSFGIEGNLKYIVPKDVIPGTIDDGSNSDAMNAAMAEAAAAGTILGISNRPGGYGFAKKLIIPDGLEMWIEPGTIFYLDGTNVGRFVTQANVDVPIQVQIYNLHVRARSTESAGMFYLNLKDSMLWRPQTSKYQGGQAFLIALYRSQVWSPLIGGSDNALGTGAFRVFGGEDSVIVAGYGECGDDLWQFVAGANTESNIFNLPIRNVWYLGCRGKSVNARFAVGSTDETVSNPIDNCGWRDCIGYGGKQSLLIYNKSDFSYFMRAYRDGAQATVGLYTITLRGFAPFSVGEVIVMSGAGDPTWDKQVTVTSIGHAVTGPLAGVIFNSGAGTITRTDVDEDGVPGSFVTDGFAVGAYVYVNAPTGLNHRRSFLMTAVSPTVLTVSGPMLSQTSSVDQLTDRVTLRYADTNPAGNSPVTTVTKTTGVLNGVTFTAEDSRITRATGSFITDGFLVGDHVIVAGSIENNGSAFDLIAVTNAQLTVTPLPGFPPVNSEVADGVTISGVNQAPMRATRKTPASIDRIVFDGAIDGTTNTAASSIGVIGTQTRTRIDCEMDNPYGSVLEVRGNVTTLDAKVYNNLPQRLTTRAGIWLRGGIDLDIGGTLKAPSAADGIRIEAGVIARLRIDVQEIASGFYGVHQFGGLMKLLNSRLSEAASAIGTARGILIGAGSKARMIAIDYSGLTNTARQQLLGIDVGALDVVSRDAIGLPTGGIFGVVTVGTSPYVSEKLPASEVYAISGGAVTNVKIGTTVILQQPIVGDTFTVTCPPWQTIEVNFTTAPVIRRYPLN